MNLSQEKTAPDVKKSRKYLELKRTSQYICPVDIENTMKNAVVLISVLLLPVVITSGSEKGV